MTLPYISVTVVTVATITAIAGLKVFDIVAATTGGNFGTSTIANEFYRIYFVQNRSGFGSAYAVLMFLLVIPVVVINRRASDEPRSGHEHRQPRVPARAWSPSRSRPRTIGRGASGQHDVDAAMGGEPVGRSISASLSSRWGASSS